MKDQDVDFRFMALSDLTNTAIEDPALFGSDDALEARTVSEVLKLVEDKNSEVKNQAVKWYVTLSCVRMSDLSEPCPKHWTTHQEYPGATDEHGH
jgi:hypothetical protein